MKMQSEATQDCMPLKFAVAPQDKPTRRRPVTARPKPAATKAILRNSQITRPALMARFSFTTLLSAKPNEPGPTPPRVALHEGAPSRSTAVLYGGVGLG